MTKGRWVLAGGAAFVVAAVLVAAGILIWRPEIPVAASPAPQSFDRTLVKQGEGLAHLGNCLICHTADNGTPYAGGRALQTPFGTVFATNITPAAESGIGLWPRQAFARAMREGVARDGSFLYPAFPYDHFTKASDSELDALYAFLMTRPAVELRAPANQLRWPYDQRWMMAGWNRLFLHKGPDSGSDRGRVLAEGLTHCGGCHTPRNDLGAEDVARAYDGAWSEGWYAPPINKHSPAAQPWTTDELFAYLRTGLGTRHAAAAGPMAAVTRELAQAPEQDVRALAAYFAGLMAQAPAATEPRAPEDRQSLADQATPIGSALFAGACAQCHEAGAPMMQQGRPPLSWGTQLREDTPHDTLHIVMHGLHPPPGQSGPEMPGFAADFNDREIAALVTYVRLRFTELPPWPFPEQAAADVRKGVGE